MFNACANSRLSAIGLLLVMASCLVLSIVLTGQTVPAPVQPPAPAQPRSPAKTDSKRRERNLPLKFGMTQKVQGWSQPSAILM